MRYRHWNDAPCKGDYLNCIVVFKRKTETIVNIFVGDDR